MDPTLTILWQLMPQQSPAGSYRSVPDSAGDHPLITETQPESAFAWGVSWTLLDVCQGLSYCLALIWARETVAFSSDGGYCPIIGAEGSCRGSNSWRAEFATLAPDREPGSKGPLRTGGNAEADRKTSRSRCRRYLLGRQTLRSWENISLEQIPIPLCWPA